MEIRVGSILEGNVKNITKFGAFITLPGGRSGLVHISEIAHSYVNDVKDHLQEGQEVRVKVVGIDDAGRINLSIKKAMDPPPQATPSQQPPRQSRSYRESRSPAPSPSPRSTTSGQAPANQDFEHMMKQFMQSSDSKLSSLRMHERRSSRRGGNR